MQWDVVAVQPVGNRTFIVTFSGGLTGQVHISRSYCTGVFAPLLDDALLEQVRVHNGALTWPNGLDLAPDTMYREIIQSPDGFYEVGQWRQGGPASYAQPHPA
jgi:hypothetical protein